jgi:hypothetical protein
MSNAGLCLAPKTLPESVSELLERFGESDADLRVWARAYDEQAARGRALHALSPQERAKGGAVISKRSADYEVRFFAKVRAIWRDRGPLTFKEMQPELRVWCDRENIPYKDTTIRDRITKLRKIVRAEGR